MTGDRATGPDPQRQELLRALAAMALSPPPHCAAAAASLDLPVPTAGEHTAVFVLSAPPHAAIYLGDEGKLGGEGADRVAGFWRVLGLSPPADADHLGALLMLAAELGDAAAAAGSPRTAAALIAARDSLIREHLWSWTPAYLGAVARLGTAALGPWARLTLSALAAETRLTAAPNTLPLALRAAPPPLTAELARRDGSSLLDALLTPVRSGMIVTREDLRQAAEAAGTGYRIGERRYALRAMFDQDPVATLDWLAGFARRWQAWHGDAPAVDGGPDLRQWWAARAGSSARALDELQRELVASH